MERKFSFIYAEMVQDEKDFVGHIAYSLYKANKIEYIRRFKAGDIYKPISEAELDAYHRSSLTNITALRTQAELLLSNLVRLSLDETALRLEREIKANQEAALRAIIQPITPPKPKGPWDGFWMSVLVKGVQTLVVAAIFFLIIFGASAKDDFWGTLRSMLPESGKLENVQKTERVEHHDRADASPKH